MCVFLYMHMQFRALDVVLFIIIAGGLYSAEFCMVVFDFSMNYKLRIPTKLED